jgi:hypothetical protein
MRTILQLILVAAFLVSGALAQGQNPPRFEDYPVRKKFTGKSAPAIISHPRARLFRTMIRTQAQNEPNFASHYTLATWGCGSGCRGFAVIDARTGRVYFNPKALNVGTVPYQDEDSLQFRPDSRLLIVSGYVDGFRGFQDEAKFYYEWKDNRFRLIRRTKIKKYGQ